MTPDAPREPEAEDPFLKIRRELEEMDPPDERVELKDRLLVDRSAPALDEASLGEIEARAAAARGRYQARKAEENRRLGQDRDASRGLGVGLTVFYAIAGLPLAGAGIGWFMDNRLGGSGWKPILALIGAVLGIGYAVLVLNREDARRR